MKTQPSSLESLVSQERIEEPEDLDYKCKWESKRVSFTDCEPRNFDRWARKVTKYLSLRNRTKKNNTKTIKIKTDNFHQDHGSFLQLGFILWKLYEKGESGFHPREYDEYCKWAK